MPRMTGARFMVQTMQAYGVTHAFYMPMVVTRALVEMEKVGIRRIMTHGEKAAAYMADGYARAAHRAGVCMAQNVGAANLAAGLQDAYLAGSPVIAMTGRRTPMQQYRHSLPGNRPRAALRGRDQVQRAGGQRRAVAPAAAPGLPGGHVGRARAGPSGLARDHWQRGHGRRSGPGRDRGSCPSPMCRPSAASRRWPWSGRPCGYWPVPGGRSSSLAAAWCPRRRSGKSWNWPSGCPFRSPPR